MADEILYLKKMETRNHLKNGARPKSLMSRMFYNIIKMKKIKYITICALLIGATALNSCKKEGPIGPQGEQGIQGEQGPNAKTYEFNMTFAPSTPSQFYVIPGLNFTYGDVLLGFIYYEEFSGTKYWAPLPYTSVNRVFLFNFNENNGTFWVDLKNATTGADFPYTTSTTLGFRAVHIKSSWIKDNPNVNLNDYEELKEALDL
jgi:hypothetical protein